MAGLVLVPLDGSRNSKQAIPVARAFASRGYSILVLHALTPHAVPEGSWESVEPIFRGREERWLQKAANDLSREGAQVLFEVITGQPAEVILDRAEHNRASIVAMASHGKTGFEIWAIGSVTEKVVRLSSIPVVVCRKRETSAPFPTFSSLLVTLDGSETSAAVLPKVVEVAKAIGSHVTLLGVERTLSRQDLQVSLDGVAHDLAGQGLGISVRIRKGDPREEILEECGASNYDLRAMAPHGRSGLEKWLLGSVTEKVIRWAQIPAMVVRAVPLREK